MGCEQLGRVFGTNLFGFENWGCLNQLESTTVKNDILMAIIQNARNICEINDEQNRHILAITELLTEQNFIEVNLYLRMKNSLKFGKDLSFKSISKVRFAPRGGVETTFKYHPQTKVKHIRRKLESTSNAPDAAAPVKRKDSVGTQNSTTDTLIFLIRMREKDQAIISRLVNEDDKAVLGTQFLKSEEFIEAVLVDSRAQPDQNIELQYASNWLSVTVELQ